MRETKIRNGMQVTEIEYEVWKYELKQMAANITVSIPEGGTVLSSKIQRDTVCIWVLVDPEVEPEERTFHIIGTGHPIKSMDRAEDLKHIGTVMTDDHRFVFHVFERMEVT